MKITPDTNILIRAVVRDDVKQAQAATKLLKEAELIAVSLPCLCEFVWVLRRVYNFGLGDISAALDALLDASNVAVNRPAVDAGLIAYEGNWLGAETFVSFDKKAVSLITKQGQQAKLLT